MKFDVVIPTKNRPDDLNRLFESITKQIEKPARVVIIDQSDNIAVQKESGDFEVNHVHAPYVSGLTAAKNLGVSYCNSEIVYFFDDDIILDPDFFQIMNSHFENDPEIYGMCGKQKNCKDSFINILFFSLFHIGAYKDIRRKCNSGYIKELLVKTNIISGGITGYRRKVFDDYLFDEGLVRYCLGEDMDFSYRVSRHHTICFATDALALHNHSQIGRYDAKESYACKVAGFSYFYDKNLTKTFFNKLSYSLVLVGIVVDALYYTISHFSMDALKGIIKGRKYVRGHYKNVPFIDVNKISI